MIPAEPASITTYVPGIGTPGHIITIIDRLPHKGERGWWFRDSAHDDITDVLAEIVRTQSHRKYLGWPSDGTEYMWLTLGYRAVTVECILEPEPEGESEHHHHAHLDCPCGHPPGTVGPCAGCNCCDEGCEPTATVTLTRAELWFMLDLVVSPPMNEFTHSRDVAAKLRTALAECRAGGGTP